MGMFRRGVPGGLSSLLLMVLNLVRLSGNSHFLISTVSFLGAMVRKRGRNSGEGAEHGGKARKREMKNLRSCTACHNTSESSLLRPMYTFPLPLRITSAC